MEGSGTASTRGPVQAQLGCEGTGKTVSDVQKLQTELTALTKAISIINHLAAELDIHTAMNNVRQVVLEMLQCEKVTLFLVFDRRRELRGITRGANNTEFVIRVKFGEGIAGVVAATGQLMNIRDTYAHPLFNSTIDRATGFHTRNMLSCAIRDMSGKNVAVLQALNKHAGEHFSETDERLLKLFGTHLGNTIAKAKLHESARRERNRLTALYTFFKAMAGADDLDELLLLARSALHEVLQTSHAFVFLLDAPRKELWTNFTAPQTLELASVRVSLGSGVVGQAAAKKQPVVLNRDSEAYTLPPRSSSAAQVLDRVTSLEQAAAAAAASGSPRAPAAASGGSSGTSKTADSFTISPLLPPPRTSHSSSGVPTPTGHAGALTISPAAEPAPLREPPSSLLSGDLLDASLMSQLAPVLGDAPVTSVLVQPLLAPDDKVLGVVLAVNKIEVATQRDILFEDYFTEADVEAMALFSLELGSTLSDRSLECALASALSVVGHDGLARGKTPVGSLELQEEESRDLLLRSQLISMYIQPAPDRPSRRPSEGSGGALSPVATPGGSSATARWQRSFSRLLTNSSHRLPSSQGRLHSLPPGLQGSPQHLSTSPPGHSPTPRVPHNLPRPPAWSQPGGSTHTILARSSTKSRDHTLFAHDSTHAPPASLDSRDSREPSFTQIPPYHDSDADALTSESPGPSDSPLHPSREMGVLTSPFDAHVGGVGVVEEGGVLTLHAGGAARRSEPQLAVGLPDVPEEMSTGPVRHGQTSTGGSVAPSPSPLLSPSTSLNPHTHTTAVPLHRLSHMGTVNGQALPSPSTEGQLSGHTYPNSGHRQTSMNRRSTLSHKSLNVRDSVSAPVTPRDSDPVKGAGGEGATGGQSRGPSQVLTVPLPTLDSWGRDAHHSAHQSPAISPGVATFFNSDDIHRWGFDFTGMDTSDLVKLCYDLFQSSGLVSHFNLSHKKLRAFLMAVASHHNDVPYHNFNHVCHVLHGVCMFLRTETVQRSLPPEERLALMIAAICHDMDHDGCSNAFHVNSQSELARIYNDVSVLENHHCAMTFAILHRKERALLDALDPDTRRRLRKGIITAILSTDMSHHFVGTQEFKRHPVQYDPESEADRLLLIKMLLHASDIGSAARPLVINDTLSKRVHLEFAALAQREVQAGLPVTLAVNPQDPRMCAQVECNFLDYVVLPLWERLVEVIPELQGCMEQIQYNRQAYETIRTARTTSGIDHLLDSAQSVGDQIQEEGQEGEVEGGQSTAMEAPDHQPAR